MKSIENSINLEKNNGYNGTQHNFPQDTSSHQYELYLSEDINKKIQALCETFCIEWDKFIITTVKNKIIDIADDIEGRDFEIICLYFETSKLVRECSIIKSEEKLKKELKVQVQFPQLISKAIEYLCEEIPLTPEEFIVAVLNNEIANIINNIEGDCFEFLADYKDFSKFRKIVDEISKNSNNKFNDKEEEC